MRRVAGGGGFLSTRSFRFGLVEGGRCPALPGPSHVMDGGMDGGMEGGVDGGVDGWRDGGMNGGVDRWRDGGKEDRKS